jgi:hypothetical protein
MDNLDFKWLDENAEDWEGYWVALNNGSLIEYAPTLNIIKVLLSKNTKTPTLIYRIEKEKEIKQIEEVAHNKQKTVGASSEVESSYVNISGLDIHLYADGRANVGGVNLNKHDVYVLENVIRTVVFRP